MTLLTAGYWQTTYWADNFWCDDYWGNYGAVTSEYLLLALSQVGMVNVVPLQTYMLNITPLQAYMLTLNFSQEVVQ